MQGRGMEVLLWLQKAASECILKIDPTRFAGGCDVTPRERGIKDMAVIWGRKL